MQVLAQIFGYTPSPTFHASDIPLVVIVLSFAAGVNLTYKFSQALGWTLSEVWIWSVVLWVCILGFDYGLLCWSKS